MSLDVIIHEALDVAAGGEAIEVEETLEGPIGPPGPPGPAGGASVTKTAAEAVSGHRAVKAVGDQVAYASADVAGDAELVLGVTVGAAIAGAPATVQTVGEMVEGSWAWTVGPVFLGLNGLLTQTPPAAAFVRQIGVAVASDRLLIDLRPPIFTP
jgi:hypothetical protein